MMRIIVIFSLFISLVYALEIDIESFEKEAKNDPSNINARLVLAHEYIGQREYDKAKVSLDEVLAIEANNPKATELMRELNKYIVTTKVETKEPISAPQSDEQRYKEILSTEDDVDVALSLYNLYMQNNQKDEAKKLKMRYWRKSINNPVYKALEKREREVIFARADSLEVIYKESHSFDDFKNYYYELEGLGYKDRGFSKLESFVQNNNLNEQAVLFLANQYYWNKNANKSLKTLQPLIANKTENIEILTLYANLLYQTGKNREALKTFEKVVSLGGDSSEMQKSIKELKQNRQQPKTKTTGKSNSLKNRAERYFADKEYLRAVKLYKKYFQRVSNDSAVRFHYASSLEKLKRYKKAEQQYRLVSQQRDKLYELSSYRYARVMIAQRDEIKWDRARDVLTDLWESIINHESSKESDEILKYTQRDLETLSQPMPKATMHKDVMLTAEQSKILGESTFSESSIQNQHVSSIKGMINPNLSAISADTNIQATAFTTMLNDDSVQNRGYGVTLANQNISLTAKQSTFKDGEDRNRSKKLDVATLSATYSNNDNFSVSLGVNSFDDKTDVVGKVEFRKAYKNHNITYGIGYESGIFINGATCMVDNDISAVSLSLYDLMLLQNLEETELTLVINSFSDNNLNINGWVNYPIYRVINSSLENSFALVGSYEYNSKKDTCYNAADFFDSTQIEMTSKYQFSKGFVEAKGSVGYSFKNAKTLYSYGLMLQLIASSSVDVSVDCKHYQSGYSPDGADECYASFTHVW